MKKILFLFAAILSLSLFSCKKTGSITVTVTKHLVGQPVEVVDSVVVLARSVKDCTKIYGADASPQGIAIISDVNNGSYEILAQRTGGGQIMVDELVANVRGGKNTDVTLVIQ